MYEMKYWREWRNNENSKRMYLYFIMPMYGVEMKKESEEMMIMLSCLREGKKKA